MQTKTAAAYARFSSDNQRAESIDAQFADIDRYAERMGYTVVARYADEAKSATTDRRPEFQRMISDAETGAFAAVLVFKLDRFSRDRYDFAFYRRKLARSGVKIVSINENLSDDPESVIMESVLEGMAEYYSRNLSRDVMRKGLLPNAEKCIFNGGTPPLGYDIDADHHYALNPYEAETVRMIFQMYADGKGYDKIIRALSAEGRMSKQGNPLSKSAIYEMLHNERYKGTYIYNVQAAKDVDGRRSTRRHKDDSEIVRVPGGVPRIVSDELWDSAQKRLETNKHFGNTAKRTYLLTGKIFCGKCGSAMIGRSTRQRETSYNYYDCNGRERNHSCGAKSVRAELIEGIVINAIYREILSPESRDAFADRLLDYMGTRKKDLPEEIEEYKRRLKDIQRQIDNITQAVLDGMYSPKMKDKMKDLEARADMFSRRISEAELASVAVTASHNEIIGYLASFGDIRSADPEDQRKAVEVFVDKIIVTDGKADIFILSPYSGTESIVSRDDVSVPPAPARREIVLIISRPIQKNTRR